MRQRCNIIGYSYAFQNTLYCQVTYGGCISILCLCVFMHCMFFISHTHACIRTCVDRMYTKHTYVHKYTCSVFMHCTFFISHTHACIRTCVDRMYTKHTYVHKYTCIMYNLSLSRTHKFISHALTSHIVYFCLYLVLMECWIRALLSLFLTSIC